MSTNLVQEEEITMSFESLQPRATTLREGVFVMSTKNILLLITLGLALAMSVAPSYGANIVIDDFTMTADHSADVTGVGTDTDTQVGIPTANTIGGERTLFLDVTTNPNNNDSNLLVNTAAGTVVFSIPSQGVGAGSVTWAGTAGAGLGGETILPPGGTALDTYFEAVIVFSDLNLGFKVEITDTGGDTATLDKSLGSAPPEFTDKTLLSNFVGAGLVDFSAVDEIVLTLSGPASQDATVSLLETVSTVPEPSASVLGVLGLFGLSLVIGRRRRR
jgi:MYXO-CTERM domain-containing protein